MMNLSEYRRTATRLADYLPWAALVSSGVVLNNRSLVVKIGPIGDTNFDDIRFRV